MKQTSLVFAIIAIALALAGGGAATWAILRPAEVSQPVVEATNETAKPAAHTAGTFTAFIKSIDLDAQSIKFDENTWLTGDKAKQADLAAGTCDMLENCAPNDFYVDNSEVFVDAAPFTDNTLVWVLTMLEGIGLYEDGFGGVASKKVSLEDFGQYLARSDRIDQLTYEITFGSDGSVTEIRERYQP